MNPEARKALAMESLGNLGAVKADAAGITYAVERGWLRISGGLHSLTLTEGRSPAREVRRELVGPSEVACRSVDISRAASRPDGIDWGCLPCSCSISRCWRDSDASYRGY